MLSWLFGRKPPEPSAEEHFQQGTALARAGRFEEAAEALGRAAELKPELPEAHFNLASALRDLGRLDAALAAYRRAVELRPDWSDAHLCIGAILREQGRVEEAIASLSRAAASSRDPAEARQELGNAHTEIGDWRRALDHFHAAAALRPNEAQPQWAAAVAQLPAVAASAAEVEERRRAFGGALGELEQWLKAAPRAGAHHAVAVHQPFYLAYQEAPNRELLARYGRICAGLMGAWQRAADLPPPPRGGKGTTPMKVGIVSAHIEDHSVWSALVRGWIAGLDPQRFDLYIYHLNNARGPESRFAAGHATELYSGKRPFEAWARLIHGAKLDALIYPEIGMDPTTAKLAAMRLAPAQMASWGHPETSGLPTMDYYLSAEGMEPPGAKANYTEKLVLLPNLGCSVSMNEKPKEEFDLDHPGPVFVCPGTPFKYAPQFDRVLVEIARRVPGARLLFFTGRPAALSGRLRERLERAGLDFERHGALLPWQSPEKFRSLLRRADVYLDTIGFSGFNTAQQAVEAGIPIVTREGRFLRGRFAGGILRRIGLPELVVPTEDAYVELAVALAGDEARRVSLRDRMEEGRAAMFDDPAPVAALQEFLLKL